MSPQSLAEPSTLGGDSQRRRTDAMHEPGAAEAAGPPLGPRVRRHAGCVVSYSQPRVLG
jgi:hypothetical protein